MTSLLHIHIGFVGRHGIDLLPVFGIVLLILPVAGFITTTIDFSRMRKKDRTLGSRAFLNEFLHNDSITLWCFLFGIILILIGAMFLLSAKIIPVLLSIPCILSGALLGLYGNKRFMK